MTPFFQDDNVTLYHGDAREIIPELGIEGATVITDPPYGETSLKWDRWQAGWLDALPVDVTQMWCFGSMRMFFGHLADFDGWQYGQEVVWKKHNGSSFHADRFRRVHEFATHWYRGSWSELTVNPPMVAGATKRQVRRKDRPPHTGEIGASSYSSTDGGPKLELSVIDVRSCHGHAIHPTEKPLGIIEPLLRYSTNCGDLILDPFAGSCAVLDAARQNGRRAIGVEADGDYCEAAARRLSQGVLL